MAIRSPPRSRRGRQSRARGRSRSRTRPRRNFPRLLDSNESLIAEICHYLVDGGGKRLRPTFILLVYRACGGTDAKVDDAIDAAIALELIHSATLLHDDIIDAGMLRRGKPSAFARYGFGPTLVAGDYLFCRAFELCGRFEEHLVRTAAQACIQLTEGEVMEGRLRHNAAASLNDYIAVIARKTASLFSAGGKVAADLAGVPTRTIDAMAKLGTAMGLAFQMIDDLLDILGPEEKIGKPVGSDLRAGIPSLPVVLAIARNPELRRTLRERHPDGGRGVRARARDAARPGTHRRRARWPPTRSSRTLDPARAAPLALSRQPGHDYRRTDRPRSLNHLRPSPQRRHPRLIWGLSPKTGAE